MRPLLLLLLALGAAYPLHAQQGDAAARQAQAEGRFIHALGLAYLGDHAQAAERLVAVLAARPSDPAVHDALAEVYLALGRPADARYHAEEAVRHGGGEPAFGLRLAEMQRRAGQAGEAAATLRAIVAGHPSHPDALAALATLLEQTGDDAEAERVLLRLADVAETPAARLRLAGYANARGDASGAAQHLARAYRLAPDEPAILAALADALAASGRAEDARPLLEAHLVRRPNDADLRLRLAALEGAMTMQVADARAGASESVRPAAASAADLLALAADALKRGREDAAALDEAERLARAALDAGADAPSARALAGEAAFLAGRYASAAADLEAAVSADARLVAAWPLALTALVRADEPARAAVLADDAALLFAGVPAIAMAAAEALLAAGRAGDARPLLLGALAGLDADRTPGDALRGLAHALAARAGSPGDHLADARRLLGPDDPAVLETEGALALARGRAADARAAFSRAAAADPGNLRLQRLASP